MSHYSVLILLFPFDNEFLIPIDRESLFRIDHESLFPLDQSWVTIPYWSCFTAPYWSMIMRHCSLLIMSSLISWLRRTVASGGTTTQPSLKRKQMGCQTHHNVKKSNCVTVSFRFFSPSSFIICLCLSFQKSNVKTSKHLWFCIDFLNFVYYGII